jgi:hypothetical protein
VLGTVETSRLLEAQNQLCVAAREGARLAAMDRNDFLDEGQSANEKVTEDIRSFLTANDLPGDEVEVYIVDPDDHGTPFDLDDPNNELQLFELRVEMRYSETGWAIGYLVTDPLLKATVVFRNGRPAMDPLAQ